MKTQVPLVISDGVWRSLDLPSSSCNSGGETEFHRGRSPTWNPGSWLPGHIDPTWASWSIPPTLQWWGSVAVAKGGVTWGGGAGQRAPMRVPGDIKTPPGETSHYLRPLNPGLFASNQPLYILKTELKMGQDQSPSADSPLAHRLLFCHHFQLPAKGLLISQTQHCMWPALFGHSLHLPIILQHLFV